MEKPHSLSPALKRIAQLHAEGKSQRAIADILAAEAVPLLPGRFKKWTQGAVRVGLQQLEAGKNDPAPARPAAAPASPPRPSQAEHRLRLQVDVLQGQLAALQREKADLQPKIDERDGQIATLKKQLDASQKKIKDLQRIDKDMPQLGPKPWVGEGWKAKLLVAGLGVALVGSIVTGRVWIDQAAAEARRVQAKLRAELAAWQTWHEKLTPERREMFDQWVEEYNQEQAAAKK